MSDQADATTQPGSNVTLKSPFVRKTDVFDSEDFDPTKFVNQIYPDGNAAPEWSKCWVLAPADWQVVSCVQRHHWETWTSSLTCCGNRWGWLLPSSRARLYYATNSAWSDPSCTAERLWHQLTSHTRRGCLQIKAADKEIFQAVRTQSGTQARSRWAVPSCTGVLAAAVVSPALSSCIALNIESRCCDATCLQAGFNRCHRPDFRPVWPHPRHPEKGSRQ